jgi:hypothetical protein
MEHSVKVSDNKIEVVYLKFWAGCMGSGIGLMTLAGLFILFYVVPNSGVARAFFGILIGVPATLFFLTKFLQLVSVFLEGRTLITIENGYIKSRKKSAAISEISDIYWGGLSFKVLNVRTKNNKKIKFNTYNLLSENVIEQVIETYVLPQGSPELKDNWAKRSRVKTA